MSPLLSFACDLRVAAAFFHLYSVACVFMAISCDLCVATILLYAFLRLLLRPLCRRRLLALHCCPKCCAGFCGYLLRPSCRRRFLPLLSLPVFCDLSLLGAGLCTAAAWAHPQLCSAARCLRCLPSLAGHQPLTCPLGLDAPWSLVSAFWDRCCSWPAASLVLWV